MPTSQSGSEDKKVAIPEAGHALMFDALGIPISFVSIEAGCGGKEPSYEGCVKLASDTNNVCLAIAATLAGPAASFFIANVAADEEAMMKFRSDQQKLYDIHSQQRDAGTYDEFWLKVQIFLGTWLQKWLSKYQEAVERFEKDLLLKRTLSGDDLANSLTSAWAGSKPDTAALRTEVLSTLGSLLNGNRSAEPQDKGLSNSGFGMLVHRLVNQEYDPIEIGSILTRTSDHSKQKIGEGMYFALTREDALEFSKKNHGHKYTHVLTCRLKGISKDDLVDLIGNPNFFRLLKPPSGSPLSGLRGRALHSRYCEIEGKKGILWRAENGWAELCLMRAYVEDNVVIEGAERLP